MEKTYSLQILTQGAGGGHHATLSALQAIAQQQHRPWQIQVTDMGELLVSLDPSKTLFGLDPNGVYNLMISQGWTWLHPLTMQVDKWLVRLLYPLGVKLGERCWRQQPAMDLVISLVPLRNRGLWESIEHTKPGTPMVTILTDFADCPPHFWIEPATGSYWVCGTQHAAEQARALGVAESLIVQTSGLVVHPRFYQPLSVDRRTERERLGLDPDRPTGIVSFGAKGCWRMQRVAELLEGMGDRLQLIILCGSNAKLAQALSDRPTQLRQHVQGFTTDVPYFMSLADFLIGKPGSISVSESMVMKLPMIVEWNRSTLLNEQYNAKWIVEQEVGIAIPSFRTIAEAVDHLLQAEHWKHYTEKIKAIQNRAVFEVADLLQQILDRHSMIAQTE